MTTFLSPLLRGAPDQHRLVNERTGLSVADHLLTAFDSATRRTGLLRHTSLADGVAMIIAPTNAIHTFRMRFAIDVAFVAKDGRIVKIRPALGPWRLAAAFGGYAVVELPAGALARAGTHTGDRLVVAERQ